MTKLLAGFFLFEILKTSMSGEKYKPFRARAISRGCHFRAHAPIARTPLNFQFSFSTRINNSVLLLIQLMYPRYRTSNKPYANIPDCHTFVSYFRVFQMSAIPRVFGLQL